MKKLYLLVLVLFLSSCFFNSNQDEIDQAKDELLWNEVVTDTWSNSVEDTSTQEDTITENTNEPKTTISSISWWDPTIEISDLSWTDFYSWEFYINWKTLSNVDKIEVSFSNDTSSYPNDLYELKQFKSWEKDFKYLASSKFKTLDFWLNNYIFTAYSWDSTYKLKVEIYIPEKEWNTSKTTSSETSSTTTEETSTVKEVSSNVNNLVIEKNFTTDLKCDWLTDFLIENYTYSYWNTCREITKDKSIGFYLLRLEWDKYLYEKHYINYETKEHWILLLETWTWVDFANMSTKSTEFKAKTRDETTKVDQLFK